MNDSGADVVGQEQRTMPALPRQRSNRLFRRREVFRLLSLVVMLSIIALTIFRLKDMSQLAVVAPEEPSAPLATPSKTEDTRKPPEAALASEPVAADLVADDPVAAAPITEEERAAFDRDIQAVLDLATAIHPTEMPAYNRLLDWAKRLPDGVADGSFADDAEEVSFHDLIKKPDANRAKLIRVRLTVRRVQKYDLPAEESGTVRTVYELWGWPVAANGWLYVVVTPELPPGFPISGPTERTVDVVGYFFKLQGYHPGNAKPGAKALAAPLLIGRIRPVAATAAPRTPGISPLALGGVFLALAAIAVVWAWSQRSRTSRLVRPVDSADLPRSGNAVEIAGDSVGTGDQLDSKIDQPAEPSGRDDAKRLDFDWLRDESAG